ncbi:helix-turn-helix domain-containing protein [Rhodococcus daqingensis]|uniref:Helix-turn-helix domain-containing protein n=1 Tax=Rhodococcus daqingensis TaxID=2479363 RepID=A0ABW2RT19_9NOCA
MTKDKTRDETDRAGSPPTDRVVAIIELLAGSTEPVSTKAIAERLELSRSTTTLILTSLDRSGWVSRQADRRYTLGGGLIGVAEAMHRVYPALHDDRALERLAARAGCGVALALIGAREVTYVSIVRVEGDLPTAVRVGTRLPLVAPMGTAAMAHRPAAQQRAWLDTADAADRPAIEMSLEQVRESGVVVFELGQIDPLMLGLLGEVVNLLAEHPRRDSLSTRAVELLGALGGAAYPSSRLDADDPLPISYMSAPVFDRNGRAQYELQLGPLRPEVSKPERDRLIGEIARTAEELGRTWTGTRMP